MSDTRVDELHRGLEHVLGSPHDEGKLEMIARRPVEDEREVLTEASIEPGAGLVGDSWRARGDSPEAEVTVMNARCIALLSGSVDRWALAGDQLYVDLELGEENLPPGARLRIGEAMLEVSRRPHRGCSKFSARFGPEALAFVNSEQGRAHRLRGLNARVVQGGTVRVGDTVSVARDR
ncbi:MAG TPA: MOSC domain-containing protein [Actinomycetota bacterium]|nr:MOSC domain-containing protein [Actinomycetota bacterium]